MKTVQEVFNMALEADYGKTEFADSLFMCVTIKGLVEENLITPEEYLLAKEEINNLLTDRHSTLVNFVCSENGKTMLAHKFIRYGKRIYSDWENREATIQAIREELRAEE